MNEIIMETIKVGKKYISEGDVSDLQFQILKVLQKEGCLSRYDVMKIVGRSSSTVHENLIKLTIKGLVQEQVRLKDKKGRPPYFYKLKEEETKPQEKLAEVKVGFVPNEETIEIHVEPEKRIDSDLVIQKFKVQLDSRSGMEKWRDQAVEEAFSNE